MEPYIQNYDLTIATADRDDFGNHSTHQWKPLYHLKQWIDANNALLWENSIWLQSRSSKCNWLESFVLGSSKILIGYHSNDTLLNCQAIATPDILDDTLCVEPHSFHWSKVQSISFLNRFLDFMRAVVEKDCSNSVYGFDFDCTNRDFLELTVTQWTANSEEYLANNIVYSWQS